jgi:hypothetical protein
VPLIIFGKIDADDRFVKTRNGEVDDAKFEQLLVDKDSGNTQKSTKTAVKIFRSKGLSPEFELMQSTEMDSALNLNFTL